MACARRFRAGALGAFVALLSGLVLVGPACADNTVPKREVLSDGGESGAYQRANEDSNGGGSPPSHFYLGDGGSTAVVHGPGEAVPGVGYVIPEPSGSSTAGSGSRSGGLGGPITASPNCSPSKVRYGYGNPGPGDDITQPPVTNVIGEAQVAVLLERYGPEFWEAAEPYLVKLEQIALEAGAKPITTTAAAAPYLTRMAVVAYQAIQALPRYRFELLQAVSYLGEGLARSTSASAHRAGVYLIGLFIKIMQNPFGPAAYPTRNQLPLLHSC